MSAIVTETSHHSVLVGQNNQVSSAADDAKFQAVARGDRNGTLKMGGIPTFSDPHAHRKWMKEHMAAAFRFFGKRGYGEGASGHISVVGMHTRSQHPGTAF